MRTVIAGDLQIAYVEDGPADGIAVILLHGFPYDIHAYRDVVRELVGSGYRCIVPYLRGFGATCFLAEDTPRSGEQAALGHDVIALMNALSVEKAILGGYDWGGRAACIVSALWPERAHGLVSCGDGYNIQDIARAARPAAPADEARYWYQYYFNSERGRTALQENRRNLCRFLWHTWSPTWQFSEGTFNRTAAAFDNPDFVEVVIHSYRHRFGGIAGDPAFQPIESRLALQPKITVPTIVLQGAADGVDPPPTLDRDRAHFTVFYERRTLPNIGHNLPQEAPGDFAAAIHAVFVASQ